MSASFATLNMVILWTVILAALEWMCRCVVDRRFVAIFQGNNGRMRKILLEHRNMFEDVLDLRIRSSDQYQPLDKVIWS